MVIARITDLGTPDIAALRTVGAIVLRVLARAKEKQQERIEDAA